MSSPLVGHLDPYFLEVMDETMDLIRRTFKTRNRFSIPISATGSGGMEAALCNILEPGDKAVVCINGLFGERMKEVAERCGAEVTEVKAEWGEAIDLYEVEKAVKEATPKLVAVVHAETSTGVLQPLEGFAEAAHENGALLLVDAVTSLGGCKLEVDQMGIDICYSGTQKCLNCPPGLSPITLTEDALQAVRSRRRKVQSWYLDLSLIDQYWGEERIYHHTAPISMIYALREALRAVQEEGLERRWARHRQASSALVAGIESMGLSMWARDHRCPTLNSIKIPEGVDDRSVRKTLLEDFGIEIGRGLGPLRGKIWRIGLMGVNASRSAVLELLSSLEQALRLEGYPVKRGIGVEAAIAAYEARILGCEEIFKQDLKGGRP